MLARLVPLVFALLAALACAGRGAPPTEGSGATTSADETGLPRAEAGVLYAIGSNFGEHLEPYAFDAEEAEEVARGMVDIATGRPYAGPRGDDLAAKVTAFHEARLQELARREELAGAPALERALSEPGARKTESGMILNVLDPGKGAPPTIFDAVTVDYQGTLRDGTVFDTSRGKQPMVAQLGTTTRCWQEALGQVGAGARLRVACPPSLGFGWGGWPGVVPGGGVLIYELELLSVERKEPPSNWNPNWQG